MPGTGPTAGVGVQVARGGALRVLGHAAGSLLAALSSVLLLRHLGPAGFGAYSTVIAFLAVALALGDAGLTQAGQREWGLAADDAARRRLLGRLVGARLLVVPAAVGLAAGVAVVTSSADVVVGTLVGGVGLLLHVVAATLTVPLIGRLRFGRAVAVELARAAGLAVGVAVLVAAGVRMPTVLLAQVLAGAAALATAVALAGGRVRPRVGGVGPLLVLALPVAVAGVLDAARAAVPVLAAGAAAGPATAGLVGASQRVVEAVGAAGLLAVGAALPVLVTADGDAGDDASASSRLRALVEAAVLLGGTAALLLALAAGPVLAVLGGAQYAAAEPVLRLHAAVLVLQPLGLLASLALVGSGRRRAVVRVHLAALAAVLTVAAVAVPARGATGAALAAVAGEAVLVTTGLVALAARPAARLALRSAAPRLARVLVVLGLGAGAAAVTPGPDAATALVAALVVLVAAPVLSAVPPVLVDAVRTGARR